MIGIRNLARTFGKDHWPDKLPGGAEFLGESWVVNIHINGHSTIFGVSYRLICQGVEPKLFRMLIRWEEPNRNAITELEPICELIARPEVALRDYKYCLKVCMTSIRRGTPTP